MAYEDYSIAEQALSADDVLALLRDDRRFYDPTCSDDAWTRDTCVKSLHRAYNTFDYWALGRALNAQFRINSSKRCWLRVMHPARHHTVGEVCDFIAQEAKRPAIDPLQLCGVTDRAAGAFLAVRHVLRRCGADVSDLRPSSPLEPYLREHPESFLQLSHLAPGRLVKPTVVAPWHSGVGLARLGFRIGAFVSWLAGWTITRNWCFVGVFASVLASWIMAKTLRVSEVRLSWMRDFRDLSRVLAGDRDGNWPAFEVIVLGN